MRAAAERESEQLSVRAVQAANAIQAEATTLAAALDEMARNEIASAIEAKAAAEEQADDIRAAATAWTAELIEATGRELAAAREVRAAAAREAEEIRVQVTKLVSDIFDDSASLGADEPILGDTPVCGITAIDSAIALNLPARERARENEVNEPAGVDEAVLFDSSWREILTGNAEVPDILPLTEIPCVDEAARPDFSLGDAAGLRNTAEETVASSDVKPSNEGALDPAGSHRSLSVERDGMG